MPNHYYNYLTIRGSNDDMLKFINLLGFKEFNELKPLIDVETKSIWEHGVINKLLPMPEDLRNTPSGFPKDPKCNKNLILYGYESWYEWAIDNWGTKWGDYNTIIDDYSDTHLSIKFDSAWCPPHKAISSISINFPTLEFTISGFDEGESEEDEVTFIYKNGKSYAGNEL